MKVRALPSAPTWARERSAIAHDNERWTPWRTNPCLGNDDTDSRARHQASGAADGPSHVVPQSTTGVQSPLRSRAASPRTGRGALSDTSAPLAPHEASARDEATLCGAYARLTNRCWAKLVRLSERPDQPPRMDADANRAHGASGAPRSPDQHDGGNGAPTRNEDGRANRQGPGAVPMTDATGRSPSDNAGTSSQFTERDRRTLFPRHTGCTREAQRAATTLRESSRSLLAMMDAVAERFERPCRGEDCSEEDGDTVAAMVEESRATLRGIAAGFATADLLASLKQGPEDARRPPAPHSASGMGGRTYAQAAHTGTALTQTRLGAPSRESPSALWAPEHTVLLHPVDDRQRQAPTRASEFGAELDRVLWSDLALATGPAVELVR